MTFDRGYSSANAKAEPLEQSTFIFAELDSEARFNPFSSSYIFSREGFSNFVAIWLDIPCEWSAGR